MAKLRYINTKFWDDSYVVELDPTEKLLFLYFLTNTVTNLIGVYEISLKRIGLDTGIDAEMVKKILVRFETDNKILYKKGLVIIPNFIKHQNYRSPQMKKGIERELEQIPKNIAALIQVPYGIDTLSHLTKPNLTKPNSTKLNSNIRSDKPTKRKEIVFPKETYNKILDLYQQLKGITLQGNEFKPIQQEIKTMLLSGRKSEDICKCMEWMASDEFYTNHWTIKTVRFKLPEFIGGNLEEEAHVPGYAKR